MSDHIEIVRRAYQALGQWDVESLLPDCDPEIELVSFVGQVEGQTYQGHDGMRRFMSDLAEAWDKWQPVPGHFETAGDTVLATGTTKVRGKGSGLEIEMRWGQVFRFRHGKVVWARIYSDPDDARKEYQALQA